MKWMMVSAAAVVLVVLALADLTGPRPGWRPAPVELPWEDSAWRG